MASRNVDAAANSNPDGFHASAPRDEPLTKSGHQPGKLVGNDAIPEFHAQTLPAGTAPPESTFQPNAGTDGPSTISAQDTINGATSKDVNTGLGKPIQGQSSAELRDGSNQRTGGVDGLKTTVQSQTVDARLPENAGQRNPESDVIGGTRSNVPSAEERTPNSA
ncbi:hypothetical protein E4T44_07220 [Aureobasidium sp. EXF-8845]|nr:hypothetical protein E4T44_07220 [Aureobasidium sp. EXF-8845]